MHALFAHTYLILYFCCRICWNSLWTPSARSSIHCIEHWISMVCILLLAVFTFITYQSGYIKAGTVNNSFFIGCKPYSWPRPKCALCISHKAYFLHGLTRRRGNLDAKYDWNKKQRESMQCNDERYAMSAFYFFLFFVPQNLIFQSVHWTLALMDRTFQMQNVRKCERMLMKKKWNMNRRSNKIKLNILKCVAWLHSSSTFSSLNYILL